MPERDRILALVLLTVACVWALALAFAGSTDTLIFFAPALLILVPLLLGRYVGEASLARVAARFRPRVRRAGRRRAARPAAASVIAFLPRGGRLVAASLAKRPPPALATS